MKKENKRGGKRGFCLLGLLIVFTSLMAQDRLPVGSQHHDPMEGFSSLRERGMAGDTISLGDFSFPSAFRHTGCNEIVDTLSLLDPLFERLRLAHAGALHDTVRVVHIGDSHVRGHIYPRTTGTLLTDTFGAVSYTDMGVNGATCLTFTHPHRIAAVAALKPELLILSFGTNESHNRRYQPQIHYHHMQELVTLLREQLPDVPILLTTPPGSYESFRRRRKKRTYSVNPRTDLAAQTICRFAREHDLLVWNLYETVGGRERACLNWYESHLMRPDHVHYLPEGYTLQGTLLYRALIQAYNHYVTR